MEMIPSQNIKVVTKLQFFLPTFQISDSPFPYSVGLIEGFLATFLLPANFFISESCFFDKTHIGMIFI